MRGATKHALRGEKGTCLGATIKRLLTSHVPLPQVYGADQTPPKIGCRIRPLHAIHTSLHNAGPKDPSIARRQMWWALHVVLPWACLYMCFVLGRFLLSAVA